MWWHRHRNTAARWGGLAVALAAAGLLAGCFQPLYGERSVTGGPGVRERLSSVNVSQIAAPNGTPEARLAVEVRNALIFDLTGGSGTNSPTHDLKIQITTLRQQVIVDITTARPQVEQYGINANYTLTEIATGKPVVRGQTFARVSYDNPGEQQRFARSRGQRDAENRAAKVIADGITSRLASYFTAGT
jgi:LPS-assembly lipoprotein